MSPKVLTVGSFIFWFHSYDFLHENRASVHVSKGTQDDFNDVKIWLEPEISLARSGAALRPHEVRHVLRLTEQYRERLLERWYELKSQNR